ncbi:MAG TPA: DegT/DnrJ/EryC1/StrS family aminotransferase [Flavitalea sp.]|nr:DegT/DnrJ/EryC1/StrS family aminotransferase [Flavitalea sp.]
MKNPSVNEAKKLNHPETMNVPLVDLKAQYQTIKKEIDGAIENVISDTAFIGGKYVKTFEQEFATLYGVKHVIPVANGTDSLYILMKMLGLAQGDEVITAANSWISSSETITQAGGKPVFLDVHPEFFSMDETKLEEKITPRTKGVIAVHLQGQVCAIQTIRSICNKHNLWLIEDCAQSHFSEFNGKRAGLFGTAASFSFYPGKNLGAYGDAGCIITNEDALAEKCRMYANHGALRKPNHVMEGINSRLDGLQAAILSAKLPFILKWTDQRIEHAATHNKYLSGIEEISLPVVRPNTKHSFHLYVIRAKKRDALMEHLKNKGIETVIHYPTALPNLKAYAYLKHSSSDFPVATRLQQEILSLPLYPEITNEMIRYIASSVKDFYRK